MKREVIEFNNCGGDGDDHSCQLTTGETFIHISNNDDWCGSTETGFGATVEVSITLGQAKLLRDFVDKWISEKENSRQSQP